MDSNRSPSVYIVRCQAVTRGQCGDGQKCSLCAFGCIDGTCPMGLGALCMSRRFLLGLLRDAMLLRLGMACACQ